jgi:hypothetical protein
MITDLFYTGAKISFHQYSTLYYAHMKSYFDVKQRKIYCISMVIKPYTIACNACQIQ